MKRNRKNSPILLLLSVCLLLLLAGCQEGRESSPVKPKYEIINIEPESRYIDFGKSTRIFFEIVNNADTTLVSRIETRINNSCFGMVEDKGLDGIPPGQKISSYVYINSLSERYSGDYNYNKENCKGEAFKVILILKDISGKMLVSTETEVAIPK